MLKSINLSLSSVCGADCLYCPSNRGKKIKQKIMLFEWGKKIIDEISSDDFKKYHNVESIIIGENGDAFLNKDLIKILRYIKSRLPQIRVEIFTNFQNFTEEKAEIILGEKLMDKVYCNIDGYNNQNYYNVKKLDLDKTKYNLINFLKIREKLNVYVPLTFFVLTLNNYIHTIHNNFDFYPTKLKDHNLRNVPDDFSIIKKQLKEILDPKKDNIIKSWVMGWAEREKFADKNINYKKYSCPNLTRIEEEAFIAPDGTWYACCYDSNNELVLGNVITQSINEIFFSKKRMELIKLLKNKQFEKIGGPCKTVNCCQLMKKSKFVSYLARIVINKSNENKKFFKIIMKIFA
ncbi:MAG: radical SAM/SPASM domain-containing protein [Thermoplasmatota archaeon]|jgi:MoaA/NifB/PqqE/SkfB family radical SAM enzyme